MLVRPPEGGTPNTVLRDCSKEEPVPVRKRSLLLLTMGVGLLLGGASCALGSRGADRGPLGTFPKDAIVLFDGKDFAHWKNAGTGAPAPWEIIDGAMEVAPKKGSICTKRDFRDFRLRLEFRVPKNPPGVTGQGRGNSGVYIQRRYEVQILDSHGRPPEIGGCGALYQQKAPDVNASRPAGEWQTYDILFRGARYEGAGRTARKIENARISVVLNGVLIHDRVELINKTGAGKPEGPAPGPILLQDHGNKVQFRNIRIAAQDD